MSTSSSVQKLAKSSSRHDYEEEEEAFSEILLETKCKTAELNELEMQAQRIIYIFEKAIYKIKIVALLPRFLLCNGKILRKYLPNAAVDYIVSTCAKYNESRANAGLADQQDDTSTTSSTWSDESFFESVLRDIRGRVGLSPGMLLDQRTSQLDIGITQTIDLIFFCEPLRFDLRASEKYIDERAKTLIELFANLRDGAHRQLIVSAQKEKRYQSKLQKCYRENKDTLHEIERLQDLLDKQRLELGNEINEREQQIQDCLEQIENMQVSAKEEIRRIIKASEKAMVQNTITSDANRIVLAEQAKLAQDTYKQLLETHLSDEKSLRVKLDKVEVQLSQWLAKYDQDVGDRQTIKEELEKELEEGRDEIDRITDLIAEQDGLFDALMKEKEHEEHVINMAIAEEYCRNRAATIIQKCWKEYKLRKWMRKMAKKAKKMKKAEEKVTEAPIEIDTAGLFDDLPGGDVV